MSGRFRRIRCTNWPMPIAPVSPSPLTPIARSFRFASRAPVATDGMRPWTELKPCEPPRKYAGLLLEQPIPDSLITSFGLMPISKNASMMRSEIALCPQPAQSVVLPPRYGAISRPMRLIFLPGCGVAVVVMRAPRTNYVLGAACHGATCFDVHVLFVIDPPIPATGYGADA